MCAGVIMQLVRNQHLRKTLRLRRSLLITRCRLSVCTLIKEGEYHASACSATILIRINSWTSPYFKELIESYIFSKRFSFLINYFQSFYIFTFVFSIESLFMSKYSMKISVCIIVIFFDMAYSNFIFKNDLFIFCFSFVI